MYAQDTRGRCGLMADQASMKPAAKTPAKTMTEVTISVDVEGLEGFLENLDTLKGRLDGSAKPLFEKSFASWNDRILVDRQKISHASQYMMDASRLCTVMENLAKELITAGKASGK